MSVTNPNKTVNTAVMDCAGTTTVTMRFDAEPKIESKPADIVLVMDRSNSMTGLDLTDTKAAAKNLIETVAKASGCADGTAIINGSRLGLVSFASDATTDVMFTDDPAVMNQGVDALQAKDSTNHEAAFRAAIEMMKTATAGRRIVILFTDGVTSVGGDAIDLAEQLKNSGVEVYCISLGVNNAPLEAWCTAPSQTHIARARARSELERAFGEIAAEVVLAGALDMVIREEVNHDFEITKVNSPSHGSAVQVDAHTLEWKADAVGITGNETVTLSYEVAHVAKIGGVKPVTMKTEFYERQGTQLQFPTPNVTVECKANQDSVIITEPCPAAVQFQVDGCRDATAISAEETKIRGLGRIVQVNTVIKGVCPGKRVAVAILLSETDELGVHYSRGLKTVLIPAQSGDSCQDIELKCVNFVLPEELDVTGNTSAICNARQFSVKVLANYVDTDFVCCDAKTVMG